MPGREWQNEDYRFGFQNQEQDKEFYNGAVSYKYRIHDPRIGRFLSIDPLAPDYPWNSPYAFAENDVIRYIDLEGLEKPATASNTATSTTQTKPALSNTYVDSNGKLQTKTGDAVKKQVAKKVTGKLALKAVPVVGQASLLWDLVQWLEDNHPKPVQELSPDKFEEFIKQEKAVEYFTNDPESLPGWYKNELARRVAEGTASPNERGLFDALQNSGKTSGQGATETYYRTMSQEDYESFKKTGIVPATSETFISPTEAYSKKYDGVLVEFQLKAGTTNLLKIIGVSDGTLQVGSQIGWLPKVEKGWTTNDQAFFKSEEGQVNIGLGKGRALELFNENIQSAKEIKR